MSAENLMDAFVEQLRDILSAEKQLTEALPKMAAGADSDELRAAFEEHLEQTEQHIERLGAVLEALDITPEGKKCQAIKGLISEGEDVIKSGAAGPTLDALLIAAAQKVEHYEIATYGTLCTWGEILELDDALDLLKETLDEEEETDEKLTALARSINAQAAEAGESDQ